MRGNTWVNKKLRKEADHYRRKGNINVEKELALYLSMNVITWPSPDMAISEFIMIIFDDWVSVSFDFNYNFMFSTSKSSQKGLWKPANLLIAANEYSKSLELKYFVQTPNVFIAASLTASPFKSVHSSLLRQVYPRKS